MPAIIVLPTSHEGGELSAKPTGREWFCFEAMLDTRMRVRLVDQDRCFPSNGFVSIERGFVYADAGERIVDAFCYEESHTDCETGAAIPECFRVTLFMEEAAFDRLMQRLHWGLPELHIFFDLYSEIVTYNPRSGDSRNLEFKALPKPWEKIEGANLIQRPGRTAR